MLSCIPIYLQFPSLFATYDVSKCEIRYQWILEVYYISRLQTSLVQFLSDGTAKTKLATLEFLYCLDFVKTSNGGAYGHVNNRKFRGKYYLGVASRSSQIDIRVFLLIILV